MRLVRLVTNNILREAATETRETQTGPRETQTGPRETQTGRETQTVTDTRETACTDTTPACTASLAPPCTASTATQLLQTRYLHARILWLHSGQEASLDKKPSLSRFPPSLRPAVAGSCALVFARESHGATVFEKRRGPLLLLQARLDVYPQPSNYQDVVRLFFYSKTKSVLSPSSRGL